MQILKQSTLLALISLSTAAFSQSGDEVRTADSTYIPAKFLENSPPRYPGGALLDAKEGWVLVSYVISESGDVIEPMIEDSSGVVLFERSALRAIEDWKFEPATLDGKPIEQSMRKAMIRFQITDLAKSATKKFLIKYRKVVRLLEAKDFAAAQTMLTELQYGERENLYEDAWFWWLKYQYQIYSGEANPQELIDSLRRAFGYEEYYLPEEVFVTVGRALVVQYIKAQDISSAIRAFERLRDHRYAKRAENHQQVIDELLPAYEQMLGIRDGNATLKMVGEVTEHGYWVHDLMRRSFTIEDVQGQLELLDVRCERRTGRFNDIPVGKTFNVPVSWGDCSVYIKGSPATTLSFYELPDE